ncbi:WD40-repeat-containing domain protein [Phyllosticta citrichinensis]
MAAPFKLDEGYSEDTRSLSDVDAAMRSEPPKSDAHHVDSARVTLPGWILSLPENERADFAFEILRSLRTASIAAIVQRLNSRLHLDPVLHLPPEITFQIFSYLDPETLLRTSTLSKSWRGRTLDSQLWKCMFGAEGWTANIRQIRQFEEQEKANRSAMKERKSRVRGGDADLERMHTKKKMRERPQAHGAEDWVEQHGVVEADESPWSGSTDEMQDVAYEGESPSEARINDLARRIEARPQFAIDDAISPPPADMLFPPIRPSLILSSFGDPMVNWQYLYKQKRRLEDNWSSGRYVNFQLPHPSHPYEQHKECVYTIQHSAKYVVSGSRDKTIRIWDLETQRLVVAPLTGHDASVLCLQFDERPEHDLVVSGGSDCHVIVWRFSTGQMIKKLERAHGESVLNLRFDDRYLVTCSKDKTIKVWSRRELVPTDADYPHAAGSGARFPNYIVRMDAEMQSQQLNFKPLPAFSLLMTLEGHTAAVNAIQTYDDQIVSASGDRTVKVWDIRTGTCLKTIPGHTKGIACVQFDGRRIVTGSSDETVRIFDRASGAEVACLRGHANLVRTVQAQFGDMPGNEEELEAEARAVDQQYFEARARGALTELSREERRTRNAGSRNPQDIFAYGAKLPPGGGGSRWGRIVSGSYDESIIIWKKAPDGKWTIAKRLLQSEAVANAGGRRRGGGGPAPARLNQQLQQQMAALTAASQQAAAQNQGGGGGGGGGGALATAAHLHQVQQQLQQLAQQGQTHALQQPPAAGAQGAAAQAAVAGPAAAHAPLPGGAQNQQTAQQQQQGQGANNGGNNGGAAAGPAAAAPPHHHHHHHHHHNHGQHVPLVAGTANPTGSNSRVFKLQFDARRIICCSQDPTIVGWDFANGDQEIVAASRFFGEGL